MGRLRELLGRFDRYQQDRPFLAFPVAVVKKFGDDRAGNLAALVAYYGFFSLFPLLLVFVSVLAIAIGNDPILYARVLDTTLAQLPVVGQKLQVGGLRASGGAFVVGLATALWAGLGVTQTFQDAMNEVWAVPVRSRPSFLKKRVRGLLLLLLLGAFAIAATFVSGISPLLDSALGAVLALAASLALNVALFLLAFRLLTDHEVTWADIFPGAMVAGVSWTVLQSVGGFLVARQITNASEVYGTFALVIGLLFWIYLAAQIALFSAEINVVRVKRLWPRSLVQNPLREADRRVFAQAAEAQERVPEQEIRVSFEPRHREGDSARRAEGMGRPAAGAAGR